MLRKKTKVDAAEAEEGTAARKSSVATCEKCEPSREICSKSTLGHIVVVLVMYDI
jgi:hypothetical protein